MSWALSHPGPQCHWDQILSHSITRLLPWLNRIFPTDKNLILTTCKSRCGLAMTPTGYPASADEKINNVHLNFRFYWMCNVQQCEVRMGKAALYQRVDVDGRCALTTAGSHRNGSHLWQSFRALRFMVDEKFKNMQESLLQLQGGL